MNESLAQPPRKDSAVECAAGRHVFLPAETPVDSGFRWCRCTECGVYGFVRRSVFRKGEPGRPIKATPYRCSSSGCRGEAVSRLPGRGPRGSFLWTCRDHSGVSGG